MKLHPEMYKDARAVFIIIIMIIIIGAGVTLGISAYEKQRAGQAALKTITSSSVVIEPKKNRWGHHPFQLDLCPQEGSKLAKVTGCITLKRHVAEEPKTQ